MTDLHCFENRDEIAVFAADWRRLAVREPLHTPTVSDLLALLADPALRVRLIVRQRSGAVTALGLFVFADSARGYWLGPKRILSLPLKTVSLFGNTLLGEPDERDAAEMVTAGIRNLKVDLIVLDDLPVHSGLFRLAAQGDAGGPTRVSHQNTARRLIRLPDTMAAYWAALRPNVRKTAQRDLRYFERLNPSYAVFTGADTVSRFLPAAAALSARTYQLGLGLGLRDDDHMRRHFARLEQEGRLRCYLAAVDGETAAFAWGEIAHDIFYFRMTGYDPDLAKSSAGKAVLFEVIRDLIETRTARIFDFGIRDMAYKERFSTATVPCAHVLIGRWARPKGGAAIALDRIFDLARTGLPRLIGADRLRRLKRLLRGQH